MKQLHKWLSLVLPAEITQDAILWRPLHALGLLVSVFFFSASLSPSLVPRGAFVQGLLSGFSAGIGYGVGLFAWWIWSYLELPLPTEKTARRIRWTASVICLAVSAVFLWHAMGWQNSIREV